MLRLMLEDSSTPGLHIKRAGGPARPVAQKRPGTFHRGTAAAASREMLPKTRPMPVRRCASRTPGVSAKSSPVTVSKRARRVRDWEASAVEHSMVSSCNNCVRRKRSQIRRGSPDGGAVGWGSEVVDWEAGAVRRCRSRRRRSAGCSWRSGGRSPGRGRRGAEVERMVFAAMRASRRRIRSASWAATATWKRRRNTILSCAMVGGKKLTNSMGMRATSRGN